MAMAISQHATGLDVPGQDDNMEISSPFQRVNDDIDIDIDVSGLPEREQDDFMLEDARVEDDSHWDQMNNDGHGDDIMVDEDGEAHLSDDGMMQDDVTVPDERLTDADGVEFDDLGDVTVLDQTKVPEPANSFNEGGFTDEAVEDNNGDRLVEIDEDINTVEEPEPEPEPEPDAAITVREQADIVAPLDAHSDAEEDERTDDSRSHTDDQRGTTLTNHDGSLNHGNEPEVENESSTIVDGNAVLNVTYDQDTAHEGSDLGQEDNSYETQSVEDDRDLSETDPGHLNHSDELQTETTAIQEGDDNERLNSAAPLHPVTVVYEGEEISLFPPAEQDPSETYFLQDENLVNVSISDLLQACRGVLGETIQGDQELEISIPDLGLSVSEDSLHASSTSFAEILDTYVQLHRHDGNLEPHPLHIHLAIKYRFSKRLAFLAKAANDGLGISQLKFSGSDELEVRSSTDENWNTNLRGPEKPFPIDNEDIIGSPAQQSAHDDEHHKVNKDDDVLTTNLAQYTAAEEDARYGDPKAQSKSDHNTSLGSANEAENSDLGYNFRTFADSNFDRGLDSSNEPHEHYQSDLIDYGSGGEPENIQGAGGRDVDGSLSSSTVRGDGTSTRSRSPANSPPGTSQKQARVSVNASQGRLESDEVQRLDTTSTDEGASGNVKDPSGSEDGYDDDYVDTEFDTNDLQDSGHTHDPLQDEEHSEFEDSLEEDQHALSGTKDEFSNSSHDYVNNSFETDGSEIGPDLSLMAQYQGHQSSTGPLGVADNQSELDHGGEIENVTYGTSIIDFVPDIDPENAMPEIGTEADESETYDDPQLSLSGAAERLHHAVDDHDEIDYNEEHIFEGNDGSSPQQGAKEGPKEAKVSPSSKRRRSEDDGQLQKNTNQDVKRIKSH